MDDEAFGWLVVFAGVAVALMAALAMIAFVASFLVPVELPIAAFAVLTGVVVAFGVIRSPALDLLPLFNEGTLVVEVLAGIAWIAGVFVLSTVLGPGPIFIGSVLVVMAILWWVMGRNGASARARAEGAEGAARHANILRGWEQNLTDDPELAERLRAEGWRADGPLEESRATYLRVWEALKTVRREEGRPVWPKPKQVNFVETKVVTEAVPGDLERGTAPEHPRQP